MKKKKLKEKKTAALREASLLVMNSDAAKVDNCWLIITVSQTLCVSLLFFNTCEQDTFQINLSIRGI